MHSIVQARSIFFLVCMTTALSGCSNPLFGNNQSSHQGENLGGVARSDDAGITLTEKNTISDVRTLASASITHFALDPGNAAIIYAGTRSHGLLKSSDQGETWTALSFAPSFVDDIVIHPHATQTVYVATVWENRGRVYKSVDAGSTWSEIYIEPVAGTRVTTIVLDPEDADHIYIGTTVNEAGISTIAHSENGGTTWKNLVKNSVSIVSMFVDTTDKRNMYVIADDNSLYRSQDHGVTWAPTKYDGEDDTEETQWYQGVPKKLFVHPRTSGVIYLGTTYSLYISDNYGDTWTEFDTIASARGVSVSAISLDPFTENIVFASEKALYAWVGDSWAITDIESSRRIADIVHDPGNRDMLYVGYKSVQK